MTQEALAAVREVNSLVQTLGFEELQAYHVPFDQMTGETAVEGALDYWSSRRGNVAIIGDSGTGKSSVMASVLGALSESVPEELVPVRIPVELAEVEAVTEPGPFSRHVAHHILNASSAAHLSSKDEEQLERQLGELERRAGRSRRAGFSLGTGNLLPVDVGLRGDLEGARTDIERRIANGEAVGALKRLVALFRARSLEPFLIFDDTDAWLQLPGQEEEALARATGFFGSNVRLLTREIGCGFVLAVHRSYVALSAYQAVADSLEHIELPRLLNPADGISTIMQRRLDVDELEIQVEEVFDDAAVQALALIYEDAPDLRRIMAIAGSAVRKAHDDGEVTLVTREAVAAARAERATFSG